MSKKQIKITENDLKNIISESVKNVIKDYDDINNFNRISGWDDFKRESLEDNTMDAFEFEIIERIVEAQQLFSNLKIYIEESDKYDEDNELILKTIDKIKNICNLLDDFWND